MHMESSQLPYRQTTIPYRSHFLSSAHSFSCFHAQSIHMCINCKIPCSLINKFYFNNIPISCLLTSKIYFSISNSIQWSSLCCCNIYSIMTSYTGISSARITSSEKHRIHIGIISIFFIFTILSSLNDWKKRSTVISKSTPLLCSTIKL